MLDPDKMTAQYRQVVTAHPTQWFFLSPQEPNLTWSHSYKSVRVPGKVYLPRTFPSHPLRNRKMLQSTYTADFEFMSHRPHHLLINVISGDQDYQINDNHEALANGANNLDIYHDNIPSNNGLLYRNYTHLSKRHNKTKNLWIMMFHLCNFTNNIMELIS